MCTCALRLRPVNPGAQVTGVYIYTPLVLYHGTHFISFSTAPKPLAAPPSKPQLPTSTDGAPQTAKKPLVPPTKKPILPPPKQ